MDEAIIRRPAPEEAVAIAEVWLRSRAAAAAVIPAPVHSDDEVRRWFGEVVVPTREVWVAGGPAGDIRAVLVLEDDRVDQLYVDPPWGGRGLGSRLLQVAKDRRPDGLQLWTFAANHGARRFYERHGFQAVETTEGYNEEGAPDVRYEWRRQP